jgi:hypothetical protein
MFDNDLDIIEERDGFRVRLEYDDSPEQPYDDGATPTLQLEGRSWDRYGVTAFNMQANPYLDAVRRLLETHDLDVVERYLRIFHGAVKVQTYNIGVSREFGYVAFDTAAWRDSVGITDTERLSKEDYLSEVRAWAEGDVYGYIVEKSVSYVKSYLGSGGEVVDNETGAEWIEVDDGTCWGLYGREWAEQAAREALADVLSSVDR